MKVKLNFRPVFLLLLFAVSFGYGQDTQTHPVKYLKQLILADSLVKAEDLTRQNIEIYLNQKQYDSLLRHIDVVGSLKLNGSKHRLALQKAEILVNQLRKSEDNFILKEALYEFAWLQTEMGQTEQAYKLQQEAMEYAKKIADPKKARRYILEHNMGNSASDMGNYELSKKHYLNSVKILLRDDPENYASLQASYNALGGNMWMLAQMDSSAYYFQRALDVLAKTDKDDLRNHYYRPAMINSNLAIIMNAQGDHEKAIQYTENAINNYGLYIREIGDDMLATQALKNQLASIENLASFLQARGRLKRSLELLRYAYNKKLEIYEAGDLNIIISLILLAQSERSNLLEGEAEQHLLEALDLIPGREDLNPYWEGTALQELANIYEFQNRPEDAEKYYLKAEEVLRKFSGGNYTNDLLNDLIKISLFYAANRNKTKAEELADEVYDFVKESDFKNTLQNFNSITNRAEVSYLLGDYDKAIRYSREALALNRSDLKNQSLLDSVLMDYRKPGAILIHTQSQYKMMQQPDLEDLQHLLNQLQSAFKIIDQRRETLTEYEDISLQITQNKDLYDFAENLLLKSYEKSGDEKFIEQLIVMHESSIYNRIRARINMKNEMNFGHISNETKEKENELRTRLTQSLSETNENIGAYFEVKKEWDDFIDTLKNQYPRYYNLRYGKVDISLEQLKKSLPANTSLIRYFDIGNKFFALVISDNHWDWITLDSKEITEEINKINSHLLAEANLFENLHSLYQKLWAPLSDKVKTEKVILIPEGVLFNLSFELLTSAPVTSTENMIDKSLLKKYILSYNYSLETLKSHPPLSEYSENFIAFAPGFDTNMKNEYRETLTDSAMTDMTYLTLLPQPFSVSQSEEFSKVFRGANYSVEKATKNNFMTRAGNHRIIHIATHAESDNIHPEMSKLIFAKSPDNFHQKEDNSLYTYEIYDLNLDAELAVLTACETGKPTYMPGEGMISLAHAFNYAGSRSILTGLWKIDEKSSTQIIDHFYKNLAKGMDKDYALQQAKLEYLSLEKGRTRSPQYWAGLILVGDTAPVSIKTSSSPYLIWEILILLMVLIILVMIFRKRGKKL